MIGAGCPPENLQKNLREACLCDGEVQLRQCQVSHNLFSGPNFSDARAWALLERMDKAEAEACREAGCRRCGDRLHSATYPRKPHGLAAQLREGVRRFSFCCAQCRRRATPASVRFFGRRFRAAPVFVMLGVLVSAPHARLGAIARRWAVPLSTLKRWRGWWLETITGTPLWRTRGGALAAPPEKAPLRWLLQRVRGRALRLRLLRSLIWLKPWTEPGALRGGPVLSAESVSDRLA